MIDEQEQKAPRWPLWAGLAVVLGCVLTIAATLNDIF